MEGEFPFVWLDGTYVEVRDGGRIVSKAAILAVGFSGEGKREVLGMRMGHAESEPFWTELLRDLLDRGLCGVRFVVSDAHAGLRRAVERYLAYSWQRCRVHLVKNLLAHVPQGKKELVAVTICTAFAQEGQAETLTHWRQVADTLRGPFPKVAALMEEKETRDDALLARGVGG